jgi:hypothetical protein
MASAGRQGGSDQRPNEQERLHLYCAWMVKFGKWPSQEKWTPRRMRRDVEDLPPLCKEAPEGQLERT